MNRLKSIQNAVQPGPIAEHNFSILDRGILWDKFQISWQTFSAAAVSETYLLKTLPMNSVVFGVHLTPEEAWTGGSISAVTLELGTSGDEDKFLPAFNVEGSPSAFGWNWNPSAEGWGAGFQLNITARTTGGNVADLAAGEATIHVGYACFR